MLTPNTSSIKEAAVTASRISKELLYAILSMDAYNRGYGAAMAVPGVSLGSDMFKPNFDERGGWKDYGFYGAVDDVTNEARSRGYRVSIRLFLLAGLINSAKMFFSA